MATPEQHPRSTGDGLGNGGVAPPVEHRWKPGQSGNPGGRPKGRTLTGVLRELVQQDHGGRPIVEVLAQRILKEALTGKFPFAKEVWDRLDGRPGETHEVTVKSHWRDMVRQLSDEDLIEMARSCGATNLLPPALRERAERLGPPGTGSAPGAGGGP
jgi:Family of unknown function (DUF5681)